MQRGGERRRLPGLGQVKARRGVGRPSKGVFRWALCMLRFRFLLLNTKGRWSSVFRWRCPSGL